LKNEKTYTSAELIQLLRKKYKTDETANGNHPAILLEQVANATGFSAGRWIDAAVFEMWPMHGLTRRAFEVKVSRSDFLRELSQPEKYKWCLQYFHEFWYVAPKGVIEVEELPQGTGWLYPAGDHLNTARAASHNHNPELNDNLLASFLRSANKEIENVARRDKSEYMANDEGHKRAKLYEKATSRFLEQRHARGWYGLPDNENDIFKALEEATMDKQLKEDKEHLQGIAETFQQQIAELFNLMAVVATKGLLARDEMGKHLIERWGGQDPADKDSLKKLKKNYQVQRIDTLIENIRDFQKKEA
jgi:hypothetical protein